MREKITELIENIESSLNNFHYDLANIIWENQEGQESHFDRLSKSEQIAIYAIFITTKGLLDAISSYKHWIA